MTELDRTPFFVELNKALSLRKTKPLNADQMATWWRAVKEFPLPKVLDALDKHVQFSKFAPVPADIVGRIKGFTDRGDAKESSATKDPRCTYEQNGARCPGPASSLRFGNSGYCSHHERAADDPAHMQRILERFLLEGYPFEPATPHRQRAEYLYAKGGAELVLAGVRDRDGSSWGPYDQRMVDWLRAQESKGGVKPFSYVSPHNPPRSVAEAARSVINPVEEPMELDL